MAPGRNRYHWQPLSGSRRGGGVLVHRVARVWPIDRGNGVDTLPANADDVPGEGSINQHLDPATDLFAPLPHGQGQTVLREVLLVADHNAYHLGQLVTIRRLLGAWHDEA